MAGLPPLPSLHSRALRLRPTASPASPAAQFNAVLVGSGTVVTHGVLRCCEASNATGVDEIDVEVTCELLSPLSTDDDHRRVVGAAEGGLREEVRRALRTFAGELGFKALA